MEKDEHVADIQQKAPQERQPIQTFVFFDIETTGLDANDRITELSLIAVHREELLCDPKRKPRVLNKLTVCTNPKKIIDVMVESMTGLSNCNLEKQKSFDADLVSLLRLFLLRLDTPTCLIAHNGYAFDFPRLMSEATSVDETALPEEILCADSLPLMRHLEPQLTPSLPSDTPPQSPDKSPQKAPRLSYKLSEVYRRHTGREPLVSHSSEGDCMTLMALVHLSAASAIEWLDSNAVSITSFAIPVEQSLIAQSLSSSELKCP